MNQKTPVILVTDLRPNKGGRTQAIIKRANMLTTVYEKVIIITMNYQKNFENDINSLYYNKKLNENVIVLNFLEELKFGNKIKSLINKVIPQGRFSIKNLNRNEIEGEIHNSYEKYDNKNRLTNIDYINGNNQLVKREEFNTKGELSRAVYMDSDTSDPRLIKYFNNKKENYLSVEMNSKKSKGDFTILSTENRVRKYNSLFELQLEWLNKTCSKIKYPTIICDTRKTDKLLVNLKHKNIKKTAIIHGNHLAKPHNDVTKMRGPHKRLLDYNKKVDKIIVLTHEQKKDIELMYPISDKIEVIPHSNEVTFVQKEEKTIKRNNKKVITMARYNKVKRIDEAIKAFKIVVEFVPDAIYNIYGTGPLKKELKNLIKELDLENNVFLKGYCSNPHLAYQSAVCSVLTSEYEGFGLVITESMTEGTPVVSYDIKYGPKEIITDGEDGYLIKNGDKSMLADRVITLLENNELREQISQNAYNVCETFSEEKYKRNWVNLIESK